MLIKERSKKRIEDAFYYIEDKLEKFKMNNNPKKMADLRKYCTTSITGGISSRLLLNSGRSGTNGKAPSGSNTNTDTQPRLTKRFYQSTSDLDMNSLITIDENIQKQTNTNNSRFFKELGPSIQQDESNTIDQSIIDLENLVRFNNDASCSIVELLDKEWKA
jgi:hypothetical protein